MGEDGKTIEWAPGKSPYGPNVFYYAHFEVEKHYSKKNQKSVGMRRGGASRFAKRTGYTPFIMSTQSSRASERDISLQLLQCGVPGIHTQLPIEGVAVHGVFVVESPTFLTKKGQINLRGGDLDNIVQSYKDILVKTKVLYDDSLITSLTAFKRHGSVNRITIWLLRDENFIFP